MALKGWPAPEVWISLHPALALAKSLERHNALLPIFWGLFANVLTQGRVAEALPWAQEMLEMAEETGDADLCLRDTHMPAPATAGLVSTKALQHADTRCWTSTATRSIAISRTY
jgi:hypothetical protein